MKIYHVLGSHIEHHNKTVLDFLSNTLMNAVNPTLCQRVLMVGRVGEYPALEITHFASKKAIAAELRARAKREKDAFFLLHGQFNPFIWLDIAFNRLPVERLGWHIWGGDLYEASHAWQFRLFYPLRRFAQRKLRYVYATQGDLHVFTSINAHAQCQTLYFPTKMSDALPENTQHLDGEPLTILLGNSGDPTNRHLEALAAIQSAVGNTTRVIIPMGYPENNQAYIEQVRARARVLFGENVVTILKEKLAFADYLNLLQRCDVGYFNFERQQGIGTICLLIAMNIPLVLHPSNPFCLDMQAQGVPFLTPEQLNREAIKQVKVRLQQLDKHHIAFFPPNYVQGWQTLLERLACAQERGARC
ncbi:TDP-N-acetylfucosamine:lipid II N-acetylfucosaminyltransferase [Spirabiliibacterium pneumoniae]|uniref:TDP-N-acetylfucosamine:lipid II N-acetylfucosaminyltransferase n=1 Tax=Spirabiliibacterium pneumoniae TaxID=221400 RepID=UPI001F4093D3|nr:TDP-N-acetylfucosamine:lipid II N-acetylfucosaminyltransferase [Spirabiliibacterium pneumoniae]